MSVVNIKDLRCGVGELTAYRVFPAGVNVQVYGRNAAVGAGFESNLSGITGSVIGGLPVAAVGMEALSTSANDDGAPPGSGLRTLRVIGLDTNYALQAEDVTMNGVGVVALTNTYRRILSAYGTAFGAGGAAAGSVSVRVAGGGALQRTIPQFGLRDRDGYYTVPAGQTAIIRSCNSTGGTAEIIVYASRRPQDLAADPATFRDGVYMRQLTVNAGSSGYFDPPLRLEAFSDVFMNAQNNAAAPAAIAATLGLTVSPI